MNGRGMDLKLHGSFFVILPPEMANPGKRRWSATHTMWGDTPDPSRVNTTPGVPTALVGKGSTDTTAARDHPPEVFFYDENIEIVRPPHPNRGSLPACGQERGVYTDCVP